ncbi:MAG: MOSC domain-containing protein [Cyclobacteriaceae bacterium]
MQIISTNAGSRREVEWKGKSLSTGIFKSPIDHIDIKKFEVVQDHVDDLKVHGGEYKAVYTYPLEHYDSWKKEFPNLDFNYGMFGENITTSGLLEENAKLGEVYKFGGAILKVTQPRFPCMKLAMKFKEPLMVKKFLDSKMSGIYLTVIEEGSAKTGDNIELLEDSRSITIKEFVTAHAAKQPDPETIKKFIDDPNMMDEWKNYFNSKLTRG